MSSVYGYAQRDKRKKTFTYLDKSVLIEHKMAWGRIRSIQLGYTPPSPPFERFVYCVFWARYSRGEQPACF